CAARARRVRPRCRSARREPGRTPGTRRAPRTRRRPSWPRGWNLPSPGRTPPGPYARTEHTPASTWDPARPPRSTGTAAPARAWLLLDLSPTLLPAATEVTTRELHACHPSESTPDLLEAADLAQWHHADHRSFRRRRRRPLRPRTGPCPCGPNRGRAVQ